MELVGEVAIVTGSAQGLGAEYVTQLARLGVNVVAADAKSMEANAESLKNAAGTVLPVKVDVRDNRSIEAMMKLTIDKFGAIDILVNNAAIAADLQTKSFLEIESDEWDNVMAVNSRGTFECIKAVAGHMMERRSGKIVNVASTTFHKGASHMMHYVASKGAVVGLTRVAARELGDYGITVNCIAPGLTMTEPVRAAGNFSGAAYKANIASRAIKREQVAPDLVGALLFLISSQSDFVTGQTIVVDGGGIML
jgi:NAD(P)-dependent dehydrogenase (short-subunit alcohol dehydrogenase family)